jgi:DNA replication and repair protein RecF
MDFSDSFNIIYGNNAQGKTNIIEAVFLCASGRSHRTSKDLELLKNGETEFEIRLQFTKETIDEEIRINFTNEERKKIRINEIPVKKIGDLMGHLNAVIFSPEDLFIIKQGPAERRRFIDITLSQLRPSYFYDLQQYAKILFQRNSLLKRITVQRSLEDTLEVWNKHLVKTGSRIMKVRRKFIGDLCGFASARHDKLTNNEEKLILEYSPSFEISNTCSDEEIEKKFFGTLEKNKDNEIRRGTTIVGPHRDDIDIILNGESTKVYGSQGQQRTSVLSMKLAEIDLMKEESGDFPVLLLDDVLSELDDRRKEFLLESISGLQTFITCTDLNFYKGENSVASVFHIDNGSILK